MPFVLKEIEGDLFSAPVEYALGHCVAADLGMGKGIAVRFKYVPDAGISNSHAYFMFSPLNCRQLFGQVDNLRKQNVGVGGVGVIQHSDKRYIYYLVTKKSSYQKPTYADLFSSLNAMKDHMVCEYTTRSASKY